VHSTVIERLDAEPEDSELEDELDGGEELASGPISIAVDMSEPGLEAPGDAPVV